jgi:hypothetical protein
MRRPHPRLLAPLLLGLALLGLPVLTAGSASADPTTGNETLATKIVILSAPSHATYARTMTITGQFGVQDPTTQEYGYLNDETVSLERKLVGQSDFTLLDDAVTAGEGKVTFSTPATKNAQYRLTYSGNTLTSADGTSSVDLAPSTSTVRGIHVYRDLHDRGVKKSGRNYLLGNVDPGWGGRTIFLQRKTCAKCAWKGYTTQRTTSTGGWKFRVPAPKHGKWYWRAYVPATTDYLKSSSGVYFTWTQYL